MNLSDNILILVPLSIKDAGQYAALYREREIWENFREAIFREGESDEAFTLRILNGCQYIWTIRLAENPERIIGDIALHDWDQETAGIEFGGTLYPAFQGQNLMQRALALVIPFAVDKLAVKSITGITTPDNARAIRMAEKAGFIRISEDDHAVTLKKAL